MISGKNFILALLFVVFSYMISIEAVPQSHGTKAHKMAAKNRQKARALRGKVNRDDDTAYFDFFADEQLPPFCLHDDIDSACRAMCCQHAPSHDNPICWESTINCAVGQSYGSTRSSSRRSLGASKSRKVKPGSKKVVRDDDTAYFDFFADDELPPFCLHDDIDSACRAMCCQYAPSHDNPICWESTLNCAVGQSYGSTRRLKRKTSTKEH